MTNLIPTLYGWGIILSQALALVIIVVGIAKGFIIFCQNIFSISGAAISFQASRLAIGYSFSLGLSFLIGSSILKTAIAPDWNEIAQLAAIIALRTVINFLLLRAIDTGTAAKEQLQL